MEKRLKILLECYSCIPYRGSEPGLGWHYVTELAKMHDVHVLAQVEESEAPITAYLKDHPELAEHATFHFISCPEHPLLRKIWPPSYYWFVDRWQKKAYRLATELIQKENFDLVQHVTMAGYRAPGYLWKLNIPFVWGPVGGLNNTPWHLLPRMGIKGCLFYTMRNLINSFQKRWGYAARLAAPRAAAIMASTEEGAEDIRRMWHRDATTICELGVTEINEPPHPEPRQQSEALKACWIGEITPRKALHFLLAALNNCKEAIELHAVGDGEDRPKCEQIAKQLPPHIKVIFHGKVMLDEAEHIMKQCHVLCITSMRDDTSTVTLEALERGLPIIAVNHCGFASVINDSCGIKIPIDSYGTMLSGFSKALDELAKDDTKRMELSYGAFERSKNYTWNEKMRQVNSIYQKVLNQN